MLAVCIIINTYCQFQGEPNCLKSTLIESLFTEDFGLPEGDKESVSVNKKHTAQSAFVFDFRRREISAKKIFVFSEKYELRLLLSDT